MASKVDPRASMTQETGMRIANALKSISITHVDEIDKTNYKQIQAIVRMGKAKDFFEIGDQIHTTWSPDGETEYDMPWDVVDFGPVTDPDGVVHENAMWLQSHYVLPTMQFDQCEAFYVAPEEMPAGTYHFMFGRNLTSNAIGNTPFMFTLVNAVPAGGMLIIGSASSDYTSVALNSKVSNWRVRVYANGAQADPDEVVEVSQGDEGTDLGILVVDTPYGLYGLNDIYRLYGYNRWSQSTMRQWLNSDKPIGEWWKQQNPYDRRPVQLATMRGFIAGLQNNFLAIVKPVKVVTALNLSTDKAIGDCETTIDRFFPASLEQEYTTPQWRGEGTAFKYWIDRLGTEHKPGTLGKRAEHIRYSISDKVTASYSRFRSANRLFSSYQCTVTSNGNAGAPFAAIDYGTCPCCVIY